MCRRPLFVILLALLFVVPARADNRQAPSTAGEIKLSFSSVVKKAAPAVVNVYATRVTQQRQSPFAGDPFFERFFGRDFGVPRQRVENSLGSGVLVDPHGLVVTNFHVIRGATEVKVALSDKREFDAKIILRDERSDLAILRLKSPEKNFPYLRFARVENVEVGDLVLAIGNPFGVGQTVTQGIVSALARTRAGINDSNFFIQTDAAINPGNSGGALLDVEGNIVGINTAIFSRSGGSNGIGFAIPADMVRTVVDSALRGSSVVQRPWIGAQTQDVSADIALGLGLDRPRGVLVTSLYKGGPSERAGLKVGDLVLAVDGASVEDKTGFNYHLATLGIGKRAALTIERNGRKREVTVALNPAPETVPRDERRLRGHSPFSGAVVVNISPAILEELRLRGPREGVVILGVENGSKAQRVGLKKGDVILRVDGQDIKTTRKLAHIVNRDRRLWRFAIDRKGKVISSVIGG